MSDQIEAANAYLLLEMHEDARRELQSIPPGHPDFVRAWNESSWLSRRNDADEQARLAREGLDMIRGGCFDPNLIENTALCHFFAGDRRAAYEIETRLQKFIRWTPTSRYGLATYAAAIGNWSEAAWLLLLCIRTGGESHMFFDLDLLPFWEFAGSSQLDQVSGEGNSVLDRVCMSEAATVLMGIIAELPAREQQFVLSYMRGETGSEAARQMGITKQSLHAIKQKALTRMRVKLEQCEVRGTTQLASKPKGDFRNHPPRISSLPTERILDILVPDPVD